ncbi:MAG TPA: HIT family protein [Polyangiaceae bacterium]|jgi:diadenosine tetraphosphate (Ap4A) HIT family hydrolase
MQVVSKEVALARLCEHKRALLVNGATCVMCVLAGNGAAPELIAESRHSVVLLDRFACRYGHLMVIAKQHVERASELTWEIYADIQRSVFDAIRVVESCFKPARVFTATLGAAVELPMTYSHYHVHVIPVYETDERARPARVLSWSEGVVVYDDDEAARVCQTLAAGWRWMAKDRAREVG